MPRVGSEQYVVIDEQAATVSTGTGDVKTLQTTNGRATGVWLTVSGVAARMTFGGATPVAGSGPGLVIPAGTPPLFYPLPVEKDFSGARIKFVSETAGSASVAPMFVQ